METINRLEESVTRQYSIEAGDDGWLGYFFSIQDRQVAGITAQIRSISGQSIEFYSQKSCYPDPDAGLYEYHNRISTESTAVTVTEDCEDIDGGAWFFYAECDSAPCSFEITIYGKRGFGSHYSLITDMKQRVSWFPSSSTTSS